MTESYLPVETKIKINPYYDCFLIFKTNGTAELYLVYPDLDFDCSENDKDYYSHFFGNYKVAAKEGDFYTVKAEFTKDVSNHWAASPNCFYSYTFKGTISTLGLDQSSELLKLR